MKFSLKILIILSLISGINALNCASVKDDFLTHIQKSVKDWHQNIFLKNEKNKSEIESDLNKMLSFNFAILNKQWPLSPYVDTTMSQMATISIYFLSLESLKLPNETIDHHWSTNFSKKQIAEFINKCLKSDNGQIRGLAKNFYFSTNFALLQDNKKTILWTINFDTLISEITYKISKNENLKKEFSDKLSQQIFVSFYELTIKKVLIYEECLRLVKESKPTIPYRLYSKFIKPKSKL